MARPDTHGGERDEDPGAGAIEPLRLLVVEDAACLRYAFSKLLRLHGFTVREATDGQQAIDCAAEFQPDLVLTDLMMPVMDGIELIRRLHDEPETAGVPVVAITADSTANTERLAREAGALDVITKPIDLESFLLRLRSLPI
jgi:two-component system, sensor histidine kinase and response regulator